MSTSHQRKLRRRRGALNRERALRGLPELKISLRKGFVKSQGRAQRKAEIQKGFESGERFAAPGQPWKRGKTGPSGSKHYPTWIRKDA